MQIRISRIKGAAVLWLLFIVLLLIIALVILFLPGYVDSVNVNRQQETDTAQIIQSNPDTSLSRDENQVKKKSLENYQQEYTQLKDQVDTWQVNLWADKEYRQGLLFGQEGNDLSQQGQMVQAKDAFQSALVIFQALLDSRIKRFEAAILSGEQALTAGESESAQEQFTLALYFDPDNAEAEKGLKKALQIEQVNGKLRTGIRHEKQGQLTEAVTDYQEALNIDPGNDKARELLLAVEQKIIDLRFRAVMTDGYLALQENQFTKARNFFFKAKAIKTSSVEVGDALELVNGEYQLARIRQYKTRGEEFEKNEQWQDAINSYQTILDLDSSLAFAQEGKKRSQFYAQVNNDMDYIIKHSGRLSSDEPYYSALSLLNKVNGIAQQGPRLKTKIIVLQELVNTARIPVAITFKSDGKTNVVVYKVGKLGRFSLRKLDLYPGQYTAVGSCPGYQDVRKEITVQANKPAAHLIRCEELI